MDIVNDILETNLPGTTGEDMTQVLVIAMIGLTRKLSMETWHDCIELVSEKVSLIHILQLHRVLISIQ